MTVNLKNFSYGKRENSISVGKIKCRLMNFSYGSYDPDNSVGVLRNDESCQLDHEEQAVVKSECPRPLFRASSLRLPVENVNPSHRLRSRRPAALDSIKFGAKIWHSTAELLRALFLSTSPSVQPLKLQILCCQRVASRRQDLQQECLQQFICFLRRR